MNLKNTPLESATKPRLYIGMAAYDGFPDVRGGGFVEYGFESTMSQVRCLNLTNFGGTMLYDGAEAIAHTGRHGNALSQVWSAVNGRCSAFCLFGPAIEEFCKQVANRLHTSGGFRMDTIRRHSKRPKE
ncbi:hypothetical protein AC578_3116 [Pseudocercospora eumusae]|uniref:Uncharacterized protein n=1 Tax=Pseudocercospora eumusae TaxID=321146 RepID=A0A139H698_9PEZI|nr:hypothetical protein AC578_3116 [Pseudocercospora eumusae]